MIFKIATRRSALAQAQADTAIAMLKQVSGIECEKVLIETLGDKRLDVTIDKIGGKGVFVKDIQNALLDGRAHAAVHSMKDVPYQVCDGFELTAIPERGDARDSFISRDSTSFFDLRKGATVGTSSLRRRAQVLDMRPDINVVPIRGNIQTRLDKMKSENLDGILLASVGLERLGIDSLITDYFDPLEFIPAIGQGALALETLCESEYKDVFKAIDCSECRVRVEAERSFMKALNGDCHTPIGAYSVLDGDHIYMIGMYELKGRLIKKDIRGRREQNIELGKRLAKKILEHNR